MTPDVKQTIDDMVFENRNKEYGSYQLRKQLFRRLAIGFAISVTLMLVIVLSYFWYLSAAGDESVYLYPNSSAYLKSTQGSLMSREELDSYLSKSASPLEEQVDQPAKPAAAVPGGFTVTEDAKSDTFTPKEVSTLENTGTDMGLVNDSTAFGGFLVGDNEGTGMGNRFDRIPEFPGGNATRYVETNLRYPAQAMKQKIHGLVIISFIINKTGHVVDVKVERGINPIIDEAAVRTIKGMPPWKPGMMNGKPINFLFRMPINFVPLS